MENKLSKEYASRLDGGDALAKYKEEFYLPDYLYYEANGLGPMSRRSEKTLQRVADEWKHQLVAGWFNGEIPWFYYPERIAAMEQSIVGAREKELIINGTTTTNIHNLLTAFYQPEGKRTKILCDTQVFPTDRYAVEAQIKLKGLVPANELLLAGGEQPILNEDNIISAMTEEVALIFLPSVVHSTGQLLDIKKLASAAGKRQIPIGFDLSHSAGVVPHKLHDWGVDFAVWCNYKYLNGGLGCPSTMFIHEKNFNVPVALPGWHGYVKSKQFRKLPNFEAEMGAGGWQHGSPLIINIAPLEGALSMVLEADIEAIRAKSVKMTEYFIELAERYLADAGVSILTPKEAERRGGHVTILHPASEEIAEFLDSGSTVTQKLKEAVKEKRDTANAEDRGSQARIAFSPLFMSFEDVRKTVENLRELLLDIPPQGNV